MTTALVRNSTGLVEALFTAIDRLNAKEISAEECRAISHAAKSIVTVARLELDYRQFALNGGRPLKSLELEDGRKDARKSTSIDTARQEH